MSENGTRNGRIKAASIHEERGCLTAEVWVDLEGRGLFTLGQRILFTKEDLVRDMGRRNALGFFVWRCLQIAGVDRWDQLAGAPVRVDLDRVAIGHLLSDDWFCPATDLEPASAPGRSAGAALQRQAIDDAIDDAIMRVAREVREVLGAEPWEGTENVARAVVKERNRLAARVKELEAAAKEQGPADPAPVPEHPAWCVFGYPWPEKGVWSGTAPTEDAAKERASRVLGIHPMNLAAELGRGIKHPRASSIAASPTESPTQEAREILGAGPIETASDAARRIINARAEAIRERDAANKEAADRRAEASELLELLYVNVDLRAQAMSSVAKLTQELETERCGREAAKKEAAELRAETESLREAQATDSELAKILALHARATDTGPVATLHRLIGQMIKLSRHIVRIREAAMEMPLADAQKAGIAQDFTEDLAVVVAP